MELGCGYFVEMEWPYLTFLFLFTFYLKVNINKNQKVYFRKWWLF